MNGSTVHDGFMKETVSRPAARSLQSPSTDPCSIAALPESDLVHHSPDTQPYGLHEDRPHSETINLSLKTNIGKEAHQVVRPPRCRGPDRQETSRSRSVLADGTDRVRLNGRALAPPGDVSRCCGSGSAEAGLRPNRGRELGRGCNSGGGAERCASGGGGDDATIGDHDVLFIGERDQWIE